MSVFRLRTVRLQVRRLGSSVVLVVVPAEDSPKPKSFFMSSHYTVATKWVNIEVGLGPPDPGRRFSKALLIQKHAA